MLNFSSGRINMGERKPTNAHTCLDENFISKFRFSSVLHILYHIVSYFILKVKTSRELYVTAKTAKTSSKLCKET